MALTLPDQPHFSILLPIKNGMPHLQKTVEGLLAQTYRHFTLVVQDCLSTDGSLDYLRGLKTDFPIDIVSEKDTGLSMGYARAARRATGDLVVCAACDEVLDANALDTYANWYREHPHAIFIYGGSRIVTDSPERGRISEIFQPPPFNLFEYIHIRMCPTQGGAFNRRLGGEHFRFDESLKTCFDFELVTRLALIFGEPNLIGKKAITMSARGDASSMTFRPEDHMQMARDKMTVMERLLTGPLSDKFFGYMQGDLLHGLHASSASFVYDLAGDSTYYADHLVAADASFPGRHETHQLVEFSRLLDWDTFTRTVVRVEPPPPEAPDPARTEVAQRLNLGAFVISSDWAAQGAKVEILPDGTADIHTIHPPGLTATLGFDFESLDFENYWHWFHAHYQVKRGLVNFLVSQFTTAPDGRRERNLLSQKKLFPSEVAQTLALYMKPRKGRGALILANTGAVTVGKTGETTQSNILLHSAAILRMRKTT